MRACTTSAAAQPCRLHSSLTQRSRVLKAHVAPAHAAWPVRQASWLAGRRLLGRQAICRATASSGDNGKPKHIIEGPSTDFSVVGARLVKLTVPYWNKSPEARWKLAGVVGLTLATTGVSVMFNFLGRDFFNALSERDAVGFQMQLQRYLGGFVIGIPVFVFRDYFQARLSLEWREWMTQQLLAEYFADRSFYQLQARGLVDNPDQRIAADVRNFTDTALSLALTLLNSLIDLLSFSGILYSIYPPLFLALVTYSVGGTVVSVLLGKNLVALNFNQEAREADMRYSLVRVRENAESIAFYGGEGSEIALLKNRLSAVVANYAGLLVASRNLDFFTSFYRFLIQLLPAAVVAPLYFSHKIEFGVINQSQSAFNHILNDVSLVVYQFESLAGFSAVVDRLGEFQEVVTSRLRHEAGSTGTDATADSTSSSSIPSTSTSTSSANGSSTAAAGSDPAHQQQGSGAVAVDTTTASPSEIQFVQLPTAAASSAAASGREGGELLLELENVCLTTPNGEVQLVQGLSIEVRQGRSLLIMGPSGAGKTSLLRALAGLWRTGSGRILAHGLPGLGDPGSHPGSVLFLPQKPYMVQGSLRDQLLYPTWPVSGALSEQEQQQLQQQQQQSTSAVATGTGTSANDSSSIGSSNGSSNGSNGGTSSTSSSNSFLNSAQSPPARTSSVAAGDAPPDERLEAALRSVQLAGLLDRCAAAAEAAASSTSTSTSTGTSGGGSGDGSSGVSGRRSALDHVADWSQLLSLGEQQRLAFARVLLAAPRLALLDEATSALDGRNETLLYQALLDAGVTLISVGHRPTIARFHQQVLRLQGSNAAQAAGNAVQTWDLVPATGLAAAGGLQ